jgi:hypothetical protein
MLLLKWKRLARQRSDVHRRYAEWYGFYDNALKFPCKVLPFVAGSLIATDVLGDMHSLLPVVGMCVSICSGLLSVVDGYAEFHVSGQKHKQAALNYNDLYREISVFLLSNANDTDTRAYMHTVEQKLSTIDRYSPSLDSMDDRRFSATPETTMPNSPPKSSPNSPDVHHQRDDSRTPADLAKMHKLCLNKRDLAKVKSISHEDAKALVTTHLDSPKFEKRILSPLPLSTKRQLVNELNREQLVDILVYDINKI